MEEDYQKRYTTGYQLNDKKVDRERDGQKTDSGNSGRPIEGKKSWNFTTTFRLI